MWLAGFALGAVIGLVVGVIVAAFVFSEKQVFPWDF